jgi:hypothetical protein
MDINAQSCSAFSGSRLLCSGTLAQVALKAKEALDRDPWARVLIFDDRTSEPIEVDFRGSQQDVLRRVTAGKAPAELVPPVHAEGVPRRPGRPKLGVVAREVTLLPRHWEWLAAQPGGASVTLRRLVEQARKQGADKQERRRAQEAAYRFISAMAGNEPGFEEATRALFADRQKEFQKITEPWPRDIRQHARKLAARVFAG